MQGGTPLERRNLRWQSTVAQAQVSPLWLNQAHSPLRPGPVLWACLVAKPQQSHVTTRTDLGGVSL